MCVYAYTTLGLEAADSGRRPQHQATGERVYREGCGIERKVDGGRSTRRGEAGQRLINVSSFSRTCIPLISFYLYFGGIFPLILAYISMPCVFTLQSFINFFCTLVLFSNFCSNRPNLKQRRKLVHLPNHCWTRRAPTLRWLQPPRLKLPRSRKPGKRKWCSL